MFGDQGPAFRPVFSARQIPAPTFPPLPPRPFERLRAAALIPSVRGIKIAENQSPLPQDRLYVTFNYYDDLNKAVNRRFGVPFQNFRLAQETFGFEKTFLDRRASFGLRMPLNTLSSESFTRSGLAGTTTALGDLAVILKYAVYWDRAAGNAISTGLIINTPTGPGNLAGARNIRSLHYTAFQPYVGYYYSLGRAYAQGFSSIEVPTSTDDVTMLYNDLGVGYILYRAAEPDRAISLIAPTFEVHVNTPLNHRGASRADDFLGVPDVVNLTAGVNIGLFQRGLLSVGYVTPITGPRPFDGEFLALINFRF